MNADKRLALKAALARRSDSLLVEVGPFFDGNDDEGSIGCNLDPHPGIDRFRDTLVGLGQRRDVEAVYVWIAEADPGEDAWPFADVVLVVGAIPAEALRAAFADLYPDEITPVDRDEVGDAIPAESPALIAWWD